MSLENVLDALANRIRTIPEMNECYTVTGTSQDDGSLAVVPQSVDDPPISMLWPRGGDLSPGNVEHFKHRIELQIWERATVAGYAMNSLGPFVERCRVLFRTDLDVNGQATKCVMTGYGELFPTSINNGQFYLILPISLEVLETYFSSDYGV